MSIDAFIPKLWEASLLVPMHEAEVYCQPRVANRKYEGQITKAGDAVTVGTVGKGKVRAYDKASGITIDDLEISTTKLQIDQQQYFAFMVEDVDRVQAAGDIQSAAMEEHALALTDAAEKDAAAKLAAGAGTKIGDIAVFNGADYYVPAAGQVSAWDVLRRIRNEMDKKSVAKKGRWCIVGPDFGSALLNDKRVTQAEKAGTREFVMNGELSSSDLLGFTVMVSSNAPVDKGKETIIAGVEGGFSFANQIVETEALRSQTKFGDIVRGLNVWGAAVTSPDRIFTANAQVAAGQLPTK